MWFGNHLTQLIFRRCVQPYFRSCWHYLLFYGCLLQNPNGRHHANSHAGVLTTPNYMCVGSCRSAANDSSYVLFSSTRWRRWGILLNIHWSLLNIHWSFGTTGVLTFPTSAQLYLVHHLSFGIDLLCYMGDIHFRTPSLIVSIFMFFLFFYV